MPQPVLCRSSADLEKLVRQPLPPGEINGLAQHLEQCDRCARTVDGLLGNDALTAAFRNYADADLTPAPPVEALIESLRGLRASYGDRTIAVAHAAPSEHAPVPAATPLGVQPVANFDFLAPARAPGELGWLGAFRILRELGSGGMGVVFLAEDTKLERRVALKVMRPELAKPEQRQRFLREAKAAAKVQHENVVTIYQVGEESQVPFLAMQLLEGESLDDWLKRGQKVSPALVARIGREVAEGLAAAHARGLIHRDIKPGNIWLERHGEAHGKSSVGLKRVKILDFGLARATAGQENLTTPGTIVGTPAYAAPEQFRGAAEVASDLFSLGSVLYRLCTGQLPFQGTDIMSIVASVSLDTPKPVREINPEIPPVLADLVMRLLAKEPKDRLPSAREVADQLAAFERELAQAKKNAMLSRGEATDCIRAAPTLPVPTRSAQRIQRARWVAVAVCVGTLLAGAAYWGVVIIRDRHGKEVARVQVPEGGIVVVKQDEKDGIAKSPFPPLDPAWMKKVQALQAEEQVQEVAAELKRRNPGFDPKGVWSDIALGIVVTGFSFSTDAVADISPVAALTALSYLDCSGSAPGKGKVADLAPLRGLRLLMSFRCLNTAVRDLEPLRGMALTGINISHSPVTDLTPLKGMPLKDVAFWVTLVKDLTPLQGMAVTSMVFNGSPVEDLTPLKGMPLEFLKFDFAPVRDLSPLRGMKLKGLHCNYTGITDLSPLRGMPLTELMCNFKPGRDTELLRSIKTLEKINGKPAADFWKAVDAGKAKPVPPLDAGKK